MPHHRATPTSFAHASSLRHAQTDAEGLLWSRLRMHTIEEDVHFRRQHAIGPYIVDFCAPRRKLIIELDGGQHLEQASYDATRTAYLESKGYRVLRFWNNDVLQNLDGVMLAILDALGQLD